MGSARFQIWFGDSPAALGGRPADESGQPSLLLLALVAVLSPACWFCSRSARRSARSGHQRVADLAAISAAQCGTLLAPVRAVPAPERPAEPAPPLECGVPAAGPPGRLVAAPLATGWLARVAVSFPSVGVRARPGDGRPSEDMRVRVTGRGLAPPVWASPVRPPSSRRRSRPSVCPPMAVAATQSCSHTARESPSLIGSALWCRGGVVEMQPLNGAVALPDQCPRQAAERDEGAAHAPEQVGERRSWRPEGRGSSLGEGP
jgi:hypothetical protein